MLTEVSAVVDAVVRRHAQCQQIMIADHRCADALAQSCEVGLQLDVAQFGGGQLLLKGGHRHHVMIGIVKMQARFFLLYVACALHQHAGNDLKAVGDAVMEFLEQNALFLQQASMELFCKAERR